MALRAKALWCGGTNSFRQGELDVSRAMLEEAVAVAREYGTPKTLVDALSTLGFASVLLGDEAAAQAVIEEGAGGVGHRIQAGDRGHEWSAW